MALEKPIIKADCRGGSTFDYKPREFGGGAVERGQVLCR